MKITKKDLKHAYNAGRLDEEMVDIYYDKETQDGEWNNQFEEWYNKYFDIEIEEETIPITLGTIRAKCGWAEYAKLANKNLYMLNEHTVSDREIFDIKITIAKKLNLI